MDKFKGILICTDLDDTLLNEDKIISDKNIDAIKYFMDNGGLFTFATGRVPSGARLMLDYITPNAPMISFNGGAIYDYSKEEYVWQASLDENAKKVVKFVDKNFPPAGIEVCTDSAVYFCKVNHIVEEHKAMEQFPDNYLDYNDITDTWRKVIFMVEENAVERLRELITNSEFADMFSFVRSSPWYYELLPKGATKGAGLLRLADILGIDQKNTIGIGDNENDLSLVENAGLGVAVANAVDCIKKAADMITVDNNSHAISAVINYLDKKC